MARGRRLVWTFALALACASGEDPGRKAEHTALPDGVAARVGDEDIATSLVLEVARAQGTDLVQARERLVSDALFAAHARASLAGSGHVESAERSALGRALAEAIAKEAEGAGPPTDAEVEEVTALRWLDFARPPLVRTKHVVVLDDAPQKSEKARRVAKRIREALEGTKDPAEMEAKVKAVDAEGLSTKVEELPPVAPDGRIGDPKQRAGSENARFDPAFARGAHAITEVPGLSEVVESPFGLHVIWALERIPEKHVPLEERRSAMAKEILDRRAKKRHQAILEQVNKSTPVMLDRGANELLARVHIGP